MEEKEMVNNTLGIDVLEALEQAAVEQTPNDDGSCKTEGCKGKITKQVRGKSSYGYFFDPAKCENCSRAYLNYEYAQPIGIAEFEESLNQPMTI